MLRLLPRPSTLLLASTLLLPLACGDSGAGEGEAGSETGGDGDGDTGESETAGEQGTGDGDGDTTGDGDGDPGPEFFEAGFDVRDLTPTDDELASDFYMGGYGFYTERGAAEGVHDPIFVRTMAIGYGQDDGVILAVVDTVGFGNWWTREIRSAAAEATGLSEEQIVIGATHTHAGPDLQGLWGSVPDGYRERMLGLIVDSMAAAWSAREPAQLHVASETAANRNRRGWDFTDDSLFALEARALDDDARLGVLMAFAAHPVVLDSDNLLISRDWCGYAVDTLEAELDAPAVYFNAIQGDVSPDVPDGMYVDDFERAEAYGQHVADQTILALSASEPVGVDLERAYREFDLPVTNESFLFAADAGLLEYDFEMAEGENIVTTQTAYIRLGEEVQMLVFPGESLTRNGLPIKEVMTAPHQVVLGLSGDALGYFVPSDEWNTGLNDNYEESVSVGMSAGDTTRDIMIEMIGGG